MLRRRDFLRSGAVAAGTLSFNPAFLRGAFARQAQPGPSPYGELGSPDGNGIRLPRGFQSRVIARNFEPVLPSSYSMHPQPDGSATYAMEDGGWILTSNSEVPFPGQGGAGAIRFDKDGNVVDAYSILEGTQTNCSGGKTPWETWLSCEEHDAGHTWECDIYGKKPAVELPALGTFSHEAAVVDPVGKRVYQTEDQGDGGFYRFTPDAYPDLAKGLLEVAVVGKHGVVTWEPVPDPDAASAPTRTQVPSMTKFDRGEGLFYEYPFVYVTTTGDATIHAYNLVTETIEVLWSGDFEDTPLTDVDQMTYSPGGEIFVCEDEGELRIGMLSADGRICASFLQLEGSQHQGAPELGNELTGVIFDPSGTRMYFAAQRSYGFGVIYEITGPFRNERQDLRQPTLRVDAKETARVGRIAGRGLKVEVLADEACIVTASIRVPGRDGFTAARKRVELVSGEHQTIRLKAGRKAADRLRRRRGAKAKLVVKAVDERGNKRRVVRDLALKRR
jgi:secreted PhoX family phosphatase